jgi:hypothetical protein
MEDNINHKSEGLSTELDKLIADIEKYKFLKNQYCLYREDLQEISRFKDQPQMANLLIKCYQK